MPGASKCLALAKNDKAWESWGGIVPVMRYRPPGGWYQITAHPAGPEDPSTPCVCGHPPAP